MDITANPYLACGCDTSKIYNPLKIMTVLSQIIDFDTNLPIENVNVYFKNNTSVGTITDSEGVFSLEATPDEVIVFSHVTYGTIEIKAKDIMDREYMQEAKNVLDTVVITAKKNKKWLGLAALAAGFVWLVTRKEDKKKPVKAKV